MHYRLISFNTSNILSNLLYDIYELKTGETESTYTTAPNGIIGISFKLAGQSNRKVKGGWVKAPESSVYGLIRIPDVIKISPHYREIAIGFKPFFFHLMVSNPMSEIVCSPNLNSKEIFSASAVDKLHEQLFMSKTDCSIIQAIETFVLIHMSNQNFDKRVLHIMKCIYSSGNKRIDSLSRDLNLSSTSIRNLCLSGLGRSPKEIIKIIRINTILSSVENSRPSKLQDIAFNNGYFDQAHFIHDFKSTMGMTPNRYFKNKDLTFDFYNFKRWNGDIFEKYSH